MAAIILTQDGAALLRHLLASLLQFEPHTFDRMLIVDHASEDETDEIVQHFARSLPIEVIARPRSGSFAELNNLAAARCREDILILMNNDIVLTSPVVRASNKTFVA